MLDTKPEASTRRLFASKGEAFPTGAVEQGLVGDLMTERTGSAACPDSASDSGSLVLSSLIQRRVASRGIAWTKSVLPSNANRQVVRKLKEIGGRLFPLAPETSPADEATPEILPSERPMRVAAIPENSPELPVQKPRRHQFTVRLQPHDFHRFIDMAMQTGRTYQDIIESAVHAYVTETSANRSEPLGPVPLNSGGKGAIGLTFRR